MITSMLGSTECAGTHPATQCDLAKEPPLVVDLDGTLVRTDLLLESILQMLHDRFSLAFRLPFWLAGGKAHFKDEIARRASLNPELLPYHASFLAFLKEQHARGRKLVLATASHKRLARQVGSYLGIFCEVFATDADRNLAGRAKRDALITRFGEHGFDYAGNSHADLHVWPSARNAILVNPERNVAPRASAISVVTNVFDDRKPLIPVLARALRVHQWAKNVLVFLPLLTAHLITDTHSLALSLAAFAAFCAAASSVYLLNDALDLESDRRHSWKRTRPLAAGDLPITKAAILGLLLVLGALTIAASISIPFFLLLLAYLALTTAYSFCLKAYVLLDVLCLASLYTLRVIAGAAAISVVPSFWLLAFSMFVFLSLALVKRCAELHALNDQLNGASRGRDYSVVDLGQLTSIGTGAATGATIILALYLNAPEVVRQYANPEILWVLCPLLMYWLGRMWIKCGRGEMNEDPIVFSAKDRASWLVGLTSTALVWMAI